MRIEIIRDPADFADRAREFLAARPERNLLATVLETALASGKAVGEPPTSHPEQLFAVGSDPLTREVVAAALRAPPWPMLASGFDNPAHASDLLQQWLAQDPTLNALGAEPVTARSLVEAWRRSIGGSTECEFREALHSLTTVNHPPRPSSGRLRRAGDGDRDLLIQWAIAFGAETGLDPSGQAAAAVDRRLAAGQWFIWEDARPVSALAHHTAIAGTVRIGPVYTPPELRAHGYATAAVAALSRRLLERGAQRCMLFTDLANPTSNRIYASIGYVRFADWEQHRLLR